MFEMGVVDTFEAAHRLRGDFGPAARTHGHTYRVEASVKGEALHDDGTLFDIAVLQRGLREPLAALHYRDLDDIEEFGGKNTTAEAVSRYLWERIAPTLEELGLTSLCVRVWESPITWAAYSHHLGSPGE